MHVLQNAVIFFKILTSTLQDTGGDDAAQLLWEGRSGDCNPPLSLAQDTCYLTEKHYA